MPEGDSVRRAIVKPSHWPEEKEAIFAAGGATVVPPSVVSASPWARITEGAVGVPPCHYR